jgi:hypothetical protein
VAEATKNKKSKEGRHVGLDFYDLLIEALIMALRWALECDGLVTTVTPNSPSLAVYLVGLAVVFVGFAACSNGISLPSASTQ